MATDEPARTIGDTVGLGQDGKAVAPAFKLGNQRRHTAISLGGLGRAGLGNDYG